MSGEHSIGSINSVTQHSNHMQNTNSVGGSLLYKVVAYTSNNAVPSLTTEQFDKLLYLLNNTQLHNSLHAGTVSAVVGSLVNQTRVFQSTSNDVTCKGSHPLSKLWVIDSGATNHVPCFASYFTYFMPIFNTFVQLLNKQLVPATQKRIIYLSTSIILNRHS